jgi:hypothetical protein
MYIVLLIKNSNRIQYQVTFKTLRYNVKNGVPNPCVTRPRLSISISVIHTTLMQFLENTYKCGGEAFGEHNKEVTRIFDIESSYRWK